MYKYHNERSAGRNDRGLCFGMTHSLCQQFISSIPTTYLLNCLLCDARCTSFIAFPQPAMCVETSGAYGCKTTNADAVSRHLRTTLYTDAITISVSLTNKENDSNCDLVLPKMHSHLEQWSRECALDGVNLRADGVNLEDVLDDSDMKQYGTDWIHVPLESGNALVKSILLPYGATDTTDTRRIVHNTLLAVNDAGTAFEPVCRHTLTSVENAHTELTSPVVSAFSKEAIDRFGPAVPLTSSNPLAMALLGRVRWNSPNVLICKEKLFGSNSEKRSDFMNNWADELTVRGYQCV